MGALCSALYDNRRLKAVPLDNVEGRLETGDIVLFAGKGIASYLTKIGTWSGFSNVGFLIRDKPGADGLMVCYTGPTVGRTPDVSASTAGRVKISRLLHFLEVGRFHLVVVRQLGDPLSNAEKVAVETFAKESKGKTLNERVTLLMPVIGYDDCGGLCCCGVGCCPFVPDVERFFCNQLVAEMLERVNRVAKNHNEYVPSVRELSGASGKSKASAKLLKSPVNVLVPERPQRAGDRRLAVGKTRKSKKSGKGQSSIEKRAQEEGSEPASQRSLGFSET